MAFESFNHAGIQLMMVSVLVGGWWLREREGFSWKMLLAALVLIVAGVLLMLQSANMLFKTNLLAVFVAGLAAVLVLRA